MAIYPIGPKIFLGLMLALLAHPPPVTGATLYRVSPDKRQVLIKMPREELASTPWRGPALVELTDDQTVIVRPMDITALDPLRRTVRLASTTELTNVKRLMQVKLLPPFWDTAVSPQINAPSQYGESQDVRTAGLAGGQYEALALRRRDREKQRNSVALKLQLETVVPPGDLTPVGVSLGFDHVNGVVQTNVATSSLDPSLKEGALRANYARNTLRPGLWGPLYPHLYWGAQVHLSRLESAEQIAPSRHLFAHQLVEPQVSVTYKLARLEASSSLKRGDRSLSTSRFSGVNGETEKTQTKVTPSEFWISSRVADRSLVIWGGALGYLLGPSRSAEDGAILPKATAAPLWYESLRGRIYAEKRLSNGHKLAAIIAYDGSRTPGPWLDHLLANTWSLTSSYQAKVGTQWVFGGQTTLEVGSGQTREFLQTGDSQLTSVTDKAARVGASLAIFTQYNVPKTL